MDFQALQQSTQDILIQLSILKFQRKDFRDMAETFRKLSETTEHIRIITNMTKINESKLEPVIPRQFIC